MAHKQFKGFHTCIPLTYMGTIAINSYDSSFHETYCQELNNYNPKVMLGAKPERTICTYCKRSNRKKGNCKGCGAPL